MYEIIIDNREKENKINVDINDILNPEKKEKDSSMFDYLKNDNLISNLNFSEHFNFEEEERQKRQNCGEIYQGGEKCDAKRCEIMENKIIFENKKEKMKKKEKKYYLKQKLLI